MDTTQTTKECSFCHKDVDSSYALTCIECQAVYYCSIICQKKDWDGGTGADNSHNKWCPKLKLYMQIEKDDVQCLPFSFMEETASEDFDDAGYKGFLERYGVYNAGCWRRECLLWSKNGGLPPYGFYLNYDNPYILPVESCILEDPVCEPETPSVSDWRSYYLYRGLNLDSPVAVLLQWPLTLFYVLNHMTKICYKNLNNPITDSMWKIDIVGVEQEVELLPVFQELGNLLTTQILDIHMFGVNISAKTDGLQKIFSNVHITVHKNLYHKMAGKQRNPDIVLGYNAGIAAYVTWADTIKLLKERANPTFFTDYCLQSVDMSRNVLKEVLGIDTSAPVLNPFHSPVRVHSKDIRLPKFSNAYIYCLQFS